MDAYDYDEDLDDYEEMEASSFPDQDDEEHQDAAEASKPCCSGKSNGTAGKQSAEAESNTPAAPGGAGVLAVVGGVVAAVGVAVFFRLRNKKKPAKRSSAKVAMRTPTKKSTKASSKSPSTSTSPSKSSAMRSPSKTATGLPALAKPRKAAPKPTTTFGSSAAASSASSSRSAAPAASKPNMPSATARSADAAATRSAAQPAAPVDSQPAQRTTAPSAERTAAPSAAAPSAGLPAAPAAPRPGVPAAERSASTLPATAAAGDPSAPAASKPAHAAPTSKTESPASPRAVVTGPSADDVAAAKSAVAQARARSSSPSKKPVPAASDVTQPSAPAVVRAAVAAPAPVQTYAAAVAKHSTPGASPTARSATSPMATSVKSVEDETKEKLHEKVGHAKLNFNAPEFVPTARGEAPAGADAAGAAPAEAAVSGEEDTRREAGAVDAQQEQQEDREDAAQAEEEAEAEAEAEDEQEEEQEEAEEQEDTEEASGEGAAAGAADDGAAEESGSQNGVAAGGRDAGPPECSPDDAEEFVHAELVLVGADIAPDAEPTEDEAAADENLVTVAKSLQTGKYPQTEIVERGIKALQDDVEFCRAHRCRPSKYAEHASTAADFFFQVQAFPQAEEMLAGAIQAARLADNHKLEATLVNNMGTVLRKQAKFHKALSLHRKEMDAVMERHGLESEYIILARHNLVEVLEILRRDDEARAVLEGQLAAFDELVERARNEASAGVAVPGSAAGADAEGEGERVSKALHCAARCQLDMARFEFREERIDEAVAYARRAYALATEAHGEDSHATAVHLSFLGQLVKSKAERSKDATVFREARELIVKLTELVESHDPHGRNLPALYRNIADMCMELDETEEAYKYGQKIIHIVALHCNGNQYHPTLQPFWRYVEELHTRGGDTAGAEHARKAGLKCKSTAMKSRDASHKGKKQGTAGRRGRR